MVARNADMPEAKRIVYRIGVNLGDVLIEGDDILGDGVNIAVRLEGLCEPGGVLISGAARERIRGRIDAEFVDLGEKALKNIARPVRVYALATGSSGAPAPASEAQSEAALPQRAQNSPRRASLSSFCRSLTSEATQIRNISSTGSRRALLPTFRGCEAPS